jgi:cytoskeletal protein RodZ
MGTGAVSGVEPSGAEAFGRHLHRERELRGLSRQEVARLTKLAPAVIEALEGGDSARMPPRAYLLGYLRAYAAALGIDPDELVLRWQELEASAPPPPEARRRSRLRAVAVAVTAALAAALAFGLWRCGGAR